MMESYQDQEYRNYVKYLEDCINEGNLEKALECASILSKNLISIEAEVVGVIARTAPQVYQTPQNLSLNQPINPNNQFVSQNNSMNMIRFGPQQGIQAPTAYIRGVIQPPGTFAAHNPNNATIGNVPFTGQPMRQNPNLNGQGNVPFNGMPGNMQNPNLYGQGNVPFNGMPTINIPHQTGKIYLPKK